MDSGDVDRDGAPDLLVAAENAGVYSVSWFHNPSGRASPWPRYTIFQGTTAITSVHLADADGDGWLDAWVAAGGTVSVLSSEMTPEMPWTVIGSAAGAGNLMGPIMDLNRDGSPDLLVGDADSVQWLRFDRILGDFLPPVVVQGSLVNPAMFSTIRPGVFDVVGPAYAAEGGSTRVAWNSNESISSYVTSAPGPANGTRLTDTVGGAPIEFQLTHEGRPGDASLSPLQLDLAATLDGGTLDPADLIANYDPQIWADVDGDGQLNLTTDALIPSSASVVSGAARLTVDPTAVPWSVAPPMPGGSASGLYFVELTLTRAAVLAPLAPLQLNLNGGSVVVATAPHGAPARQTSVPGTSGTVQVGDTPPSAPNLQVAVMEGGDALFDPLSGVTDAAGETVTFVGIAGAPMLGTATIQGSQILYVNDGTEVPQDEMLVTLSDGIQDVPRLIIFNVQLYVHAPYATDSTVTTLEDHAATFDLEGGDLDNVPTFNVTIPPVHGQIVTTATSTGLSVEYTPALHYSGSDQLTFVVQGGALTSAPATVAITVTFDGNDDDDNDGIINRLDNCPFVYNPDQSDINHNGIGDVCDPDMDGDGILNGTDNCPRVYNPDQSDINHNGIGDACDPDMDGDGVPNGTDNCPTVYNPDQSDINHNGLGDACDPDMDGDGVLNAADNCPTVYNPDQSDINHNGIGDACDPDIDGDGVLNAADNCPDVYNPDQADFRHIGLGDACNPDIDGDGVPGVDDCNDKDPTVWKVNTFYDDEDADGFGDSGRPIKSCTADPPAGAVWDNTDNCPTVYNPDQADSLHNGVGDACRPHTAGASKDKSGCASGGGAGDPTSLLVSFLVLMTSSRRRRS